MNVVLRPATQADIPAIHQLILDLAIYEKEPEAVIVTKEDLERHYLEEKRFQCIVAAHNNEVVGMVLYYPRYSTWKGPTLHLEDFIVREDYRRTTIGHQLFQAFLNVAAKEDVQRIEWMVLNWNDPAIGFYKKQKAILADEWMVCQMTREQILQNLAQHEGI